VAEIQEARPAILNVDEYRDGSPGQSGFPGELSTVGITSRLLILYPYHVKGLEMTCEGTVPYGPVQFEQKKLKVWVPLEAEIYPDVNGKRLHHRHSYRD